MKLKGKILPATEIHCRKLVKCQNNESRAWRKRAKNTSKDATQTLAKHTRTHTLAHIQHSTAQQACIDWFSHADSVTPSGPRPRLIARCVLQAAYEFSIEFKCKLRLHAKRVEKWQTAKFWAPQKQLPPDTNTAHSHTYTLVHSHRDIYPS